MKLTKVHIALLTNVTEGKVKNEHITMYYSKEVKATTVLNRMTALNAVLPVDLYHAADRYNVDEFQSWGGDFITSISLNERMPETAGIFTAWKVSRPHITLAENISDDDMHWWENEFKKFNWEEGLKVGECHVGWKENGEMVYRTENELIEWIANNA